MKKFLPIVISVIIAGGLGFYLGRVSVGSPAANIMAGFGQNGGQFRNGGARTGMQNGGFVNGDIVSKDAQSITVQMRDGSSKIVFLSGSTQVMRSASGSLNDLTTGEQVTVTGTPNSDGSITAQSIQIRPSLANSSSTRQ